VIGHEFDCGRSRMVDVREHNCCDTFFSFPFGLVLPGIKLSALVWHSHLSRSPEELVILDEIS